MKCHNIGELASHYCRELQCCIYVFHLASLPCSSRAAVHYLNVSFFFNIWFNSSVGVIADNIDSFQILFP